MRDIQRKFQNADKAVLNMYIREFLKNGILKYTFLDVDHNGRKIAKMFHVINK